MKFFFSVIILFSVSFAYAGETIVIRPEDEYLVGENHDGKCKIALVLSGGGARGFAQIGVLEILDSIGIEPDIVIGTSIGSVIGGLYCTGYSPSKLESLAVSMSWDDLFSDASRRTSLFLTQRESSENYFLTLRFMAGKPFLPSGYISAQRLLDVLTQLTAPAMILYGKNFDNFQIPFRSVATDIRDGSAVVISEGNLSEAMRASISVPLIFTPFPFESLLCVDGGLKMPVPVEVAKMEKCTKIIAVNTTAEFIPQNQLKNATDIGEQATTIMQSDIIEKEKSQSDVWLEPQLHGWRSTDFSNIEKLIAIGRESARKSIPQILKILDSAEDIEENVRVDSVVINLPRSPSLDLPKPNIYSMDSLQKIADALKKDVFLENVVCSLSLSDTNILYISADRAHKFSTIEIDGDTVLLEDADIEPRVKIDCDYESALYVLDSLLNKIHEGGYIIAKWDTIFSSKDTVYAFLDGGRIKKIRFSGNKLTRDWVLESHIKIDVGDFFRIDKIKQSIESIYSTGLFNWVSFDIAESGNNCDVLTFKVSEKPNIALRFGLRYDNINDAEVGIGIFDDNFLGTALRPSVAGFGGRRRQSVDISLDADKIWKTAATAKISARYRREKYDHFTDFEIVRSDWVEYVSGKIAFGMQLRKFGAFLGEIESRKIGITPDRREDTVQHYTVHKLRLKLTVDTYDKRQFPTSGNFTSLTFETSQDILGGQTSFTKYFGHLAKYHTIGWLTIHGWGVVGYLAGTPPFFERFTLASGERYFGFRGDEMLGDEILSTGIEFRINFRKRLKRSYLIAGIDMENLFVKDQPAEKAKTIWGVGTGIGIETPLGPINAIWGISNLNTQFVSLKFGYDF